MRLCRICADLHEGTDQAAAYRFMMTGPLIYS